MKKIITVFFLFLLIICPGDGAYSSQDEGNNSRDNQIQLGPQDRVLIFAPHPDDEILGCAGIIQQAKSMNIPVKVMFLTFGDNNEWSFFLYRKHPVFLPFAVRRMGEVRHDEAVKAVGVLGLLPENLVFLGYPDFGTQNIWRNHWAKEEPYTSFLTKVKSVPYDNAFRPGALYKGEEILKDMEAVFRQFKPTKVFLGHAADHNLDHQSTYLFARVALWDLESEMQPEIYPFLIHFKNWPKPRGYRPEKFLIPPPLITKDIQWKNNILSSHQIGIKSLALQKHRSQYNSSMAYLSSFIKQNELFGDFPSIKLNNNTLSAKTINNAANYLKEAPDQLTDKERVFFVGFEERNVAREGDNLVFSIKLSKPFAESIGLSVYVFGYRFDKPFGEMPKIHVKVGLLRYEVFDQSKPLNVQAVQVEWSERLVKLKVPLALLGNPQRILTNAQINLGEMPLDFAAWRVLEL